MAEILRLFQKRAEKFYPEAVKSMFSFLKELGDALRK